MLFSVLAIGKQLFVLQAESKYLLSDFGKHNSDFLLLCVMEYCETNIITDVRQPWTNPHECCFEYLIIRFDYLIIPFDYLIIEEIKEICNCSGNMISTLRNHFCHLKQNFGLYQ